MNLKISIFKALTYRILGSLATVIVSFALTGDWGISSAIGLGDCILKFILYFVHERIWEHFLKRKDGA